MKKITLKYITIFVWSPIFAPLYFWFIVNLQQWIPKSSIDGSITMGTMNFSSMQISNLMVLSFFIVDVLLQVILVLIYTKWRAFLGKYKIIEIISAVTISYIIFLIVTVITLGISYFYTMSNFH